MWLGAYRMRGKGELQYDGRRPDGGWHAHGYFRCGLTVVLNGRLCRRYLWKRRWRRVADGRTVCSRPPDDLALRHCALVVLIELWSWLDGADGVLRAQSVLGAEDLRPSPRTVQRWLRNLLVAPMALQQPIREAIIERSEPRPVELIFPSGLSPPGGLTRRCWADRPGVEQLWRAIAMLLGGAIALGVAAPVLLAEARGRRHTETTKTMF